MPRKTEPNKRKRHYRFNGLWGAGGSLAELKAGLSALRKKLDDPNDKDEPRWVRKWIAAYEAEIAKKDAGKKVKAFAKSKENRVKYKRPPSA
jgi:hypothetical protein